jgi:hypothetical protein
MKNTSYVSNMGSSDNNVYLFLGYSYRHLVLAGECKAGSYDIQQVPHLRGFHCTGFRRLQSQSNDGHGGFMRVSDVRVDVK